MKKISGKNIVVTGCNSGIGLEFIKLLLADDNRVLCVDVNTDKLEPISLKSPNAIVFQCDISNKEGVDAVFDEAQKQFEFIDIFYANAGFPYYERYNYADWERIDAIMRCNCYSPMYSYAKYLKYLNGREGHFCITVSAIGKMAMPGYTLYSASKFCMQGFQQGVRLEKQKNVALTCLYPVATATNFFNVGSEGRSQDKDRPFPVQSAEHVAKCMYKAVARKKKSCTPSKLFAVVEQTIKFMPFVRNIDWWMEGAKFERYCERENIKK